MCVCGINLICIRDVLELLSCQYVLIDWKVFLSRLSAAIFFQAYGRDGDGNTKKISLLSFSCILFLASSIVYCSFIDCTERKKVFIENENLSQKNEVKDKWRRERSKVIKSNDS